LKVARTKNGKETDDSVAIFCIDISGSMDVKTTIPTGHELVKIKVTCYRYNSNKKGVTGNSMTRLQCAVAGVDMQIEEIYKSNPNKKIVIISFDDKVTIIGTFFNLKKFHSS
jgi:hypothetical protein